MDERANRDPEFPPPSPGDGPDRGSSESRSTTLPGWKDAGRAASADGAAALRYDTAVFEQALASKLIGREQQVRILSGSALFGVIVIVLLHELGHWIAGLAVTGLVPDFYFVAVRQKVTEFSTGGGILTWGAGPFLHLVALWAMVLFVTGKGRRYPRLFAAAGGAAAFSVVVQLLIWGTATFTSADDWGNDVPRLATHLGSLARLWMHLLSAGLFLLTSGAAYWWWLSARAIEDSRLFISPAIVGAFQGGVLVLIGTFVVSLSQ